MHFQWVSFPTTGPSEDHKLACSPRGHLPSTSTWYPRWVSLRLRMDNCLLIATDHLSSSMRVASDLYCAALAFFLSASLASSSVLPVGLMPRQDSSCCNDLLGSCVSVTNLGITVDLQPCCSGLSCIFTQTGDLSLGGNISIGVRDRSILSGHT